MAYILTISLQVLVAALLMCLQLKSNKEQTDQEKKERSVSLRIASILTSAVMIDFYFMWPVIIGVGAIKASAPYFALGLSLVIWAALVFMFYLEDKNASSAEDEDSQTDGAQDSLAGQ